MNLQLSPRLSQGVTMTGQMQQAISLLQYSNTDLQKYIDKEAEENPFIEPGPSTNLPFSGHGIGDAGDIVGRLEDHPPSLIEHLSKQFDLLFTDPARRLLADRFLEAIDANGWLNETLDQISIDCGIDTDTAEEILARVQQVEPTGLFARDLRECLTLQAIEKGIYSGVLEKVLGNLPRLAAADLEGLIRLCGCTMMELREALKLLRTLNPKPGSEFQSDVGHERQPDLIVFKHQGKWKIELNRSTLPTVCIDEHHASSARENLQAREYANERLRVAKWLRRAVEHRNQSTLLVGAEIVRRQRDFFEHGLERVVPMTLADVAEAVGVHESTVSRVTSGILMVTPHGTMNLKKFFTTALAQTGSENSEVVSAAAVRFKIGQLIAKEDPLKPLSDDAIAREINDGGALLARRTVAKYREMLNIPSSFQRKRQGKLNAA